MKEKKLFVVLVSILVVGVASWYIFMNRPAEKKLENVNEKLSTIVQKVKTAKRAKRNIDNVQDRYELIQKKLEKQKSKFIRRNELSRVTSRMDEMAKDFNLKLVDFAPALENYFARDQAAVIVTLPLVVTVEGNYIDIGRYLENWYKLPFYITTEEIELAGKNENQTTLESKISAKLYTWND